jgi:four helix bundle protein
MWVKMAVSSLDRSEQEVTPQGPDKRIGADRKGKVQDLKDQTREFALGIIKLYGALPRKTECLIIGRQILRSGTPVGANYREGLRGQSPSEYAAKLNTGLMELEETLYWLELLERSGAVAAQRLASLKTEISELSAIFVTLIKRARSQAKGQRKLESKNYKPELAAGSAVRP